MLITESARKFEDADSRSEADNTPDFTCCPFHKDGPKDLFGTCDTGKQT